MLAADRHHFANGLAAAVAPPAQDVLRKPVVVEAGDAALFQRLNDLAYLLSEYHWSLLVQAPWYDLGRVSSQAV